MTEQRTNNCTLCLLLPLILGIIGLGLLYWYAKESKAEHIQNDLRLKSSQLLEQHQVGNAVVNVDGRDAVLTGMVASAERSQEIEHIVASLDGIRVVDNQLEIAAAKAVEQAPIKTQPEVIAKPYVAPLPDFEPEPEPEPEPEVAVVTQPAVEVQQEVVEELLQTIDLSGITFLFGKDEITPEGKSILDNVINVLSEHTEFDVGIEGHTDSVGNDSLNQELSQRRAQSVLNYLASNGIDSSRLNATGYGESSPIADNSTPEGRALNRRIEFAVSRR